MSDSELLIYHLYADDGVESEALAAHGRVVRGGLNPVKNAHSEAVVGDARDPPLQPGADLVVCHPECYQWCTATDHIPNRETAYENQIPVAREVAKNLGAEYIIENVSEAPLNDPVVLTGRMFRLPIKFERAFETSFPVQQPNEKPPRDDEISWWHEYSRPAAWWRSVNGYTSHSRKDALVKSGIPRAFMDYLLQSWHAHREGFSAPTTTQTTLQEARL